MLPRAVYILDKRNQKTYINTTDIPKISKLKATLPAVSDQIIIYQPLSSPSWPNQAIFDYRFASFRNLYIPLCTLGTYSVDENSTQNGNKSFFANYFGLDTPFCEDCQ